MGRWSKEVSAVPKRARDREREVQHIREVLDLLRDPPADPRTEAEALEPRYRQDALGRLKYDALTYLCESRQIPASPDENQLEEFNDIREWHRQFMSRAARAGLTHHPLVRDWLETHRRLGDQDTLRAIRSHRKGERRPQPRLNPRLSDQDMRRADAITDCLARGLTRKKDVLENLRRQGVVGTDYTLPAFRKLLARLALNHRFPER